MTLLETSNHRQNDDVETNFCEKQTLLWHYTFSDNIATSIVVYTSRQ